MKKKTSYTDLILIIWALIMVIAVALTLTNKSIDACSLYDEKVKAAELTKEAMEAIKLRKEELSIPLVDKDIHQTGLLGERYTKITTTLGLLESKRTSLNPNFAAVVIDMFKEVGLKKESEIGVVFSGSFPALNLAVLSAIEVFELSPCIMVSIGSSSYGANHPDFTIYDMIQYLYQKNIFSNSVDYVSLGGALDTGDEFDDEIKNKIITRINENQTSFIYEKDFQKNITLRLDYFHQKVPNMKMLINVGGNLVSMGKDEASFPTNNGLIKTNYLKRSRLGNNPNKGLIDYALESKIPVVQMLNIRSLAYKYGIPYDPQNIPEVGVGSVYLETKYSVLIPIVSVVISFFLIIFYNLYRKYDR